MKSINAVSLINHWASVPCNNSDLVSLVHLRMRQKWIVCVAQYLFVFISVFKVIPYFIIIFKQTSDSFHAQWITDALLSHHELWWERHGALTFLLPTTTSFFWKALYKTDVLLLCIWLIKVVAKNEKLFNWQTNADPPVWLAPWFSSGFPCLGCTAPSESPSLGRGTPPPP